MTYQSKMLATVMASGVVALHISLALHPPKASFKGQKVGAGGVEVFKHRVVGAHTMDDF